MGNQDARTIALTGIMIAVVAAFTIAIRIPVPGTTGYVNLSDVAIFFVAFTFGPIPALVAGGVGTGLADIFVGAPQFAWLSFIAHGLEGYLAGYLAQRGRGLGNLLPALVVGGAVMVVAYFVGETLIVYNTPDATEPALALATAEAPFNILQAVVGAVLGTALTYAVRQAYPPIAQFNQPRTWREM
jgi:uncharacterized membrane protein